MDTVKDIACRLNRQCGYFWALAIRGDRGDAGSDTEPYRFELTQSVHQGIDLFGTGSSGVENRFSVVKDDEYRL